jgi:hypothetical protein
MSRRCDTEQLGSALCARAPLWRRCTLTSAAQRRDVEPLRTPSSTSGLDISSPLAGSGAVAVRGLDVTPRDLDLVVDDAGAAQLGDVLTEWLIEPVTPVPDWICRWWGRAFLHARIEWVGGVQPRADEPFVTDFGPAAAQRLEEVRWNGRILRVPTTRAAAPKLRTKRTSGSSAPDQDAHRGRQAWSGWPLASLRCRAWSP